MEFQEGSVIKEEPKKPLALKTAGDIFYSDTLVSLVIDPTPLGSKDMFHANKSFHRL